MRWRPAQVVLILLALLPAALGASVVVQGWSDSGGDTASGVTVGYGILLVALGVVIAAVALRDARRSRRRPSSSEASTRHHSEDN